MRASIRGLCVLATLALVQAQGEAPSQVVGGDATFNHVACWAKGAAFDALAGDAFASSSMTLEKCAAFCGRWTYFGVSAGTECYCGDTLSSTAADSAECSTPCAGNAAQQCGSSSNLILYSTLETEPSTQTPAVVPSAGAFTYESCWTDLAGATRQRALSTTGFLSSAMTVEKCAGFCSEYLYFGVGNGHECYCGTSPNAATESADENDCSSACEGDGDELCGAAGRINLYKSSPGSSSTSSAPIGSSSTSATTESSATSSAVISTTSTTVTASSSSLPTTTTPTTTIPTTTSTTTTPKPTPTCIDCDAPLIANSDWSNGVLASGNYYQPAKSGNWLLATSTPGEGPLEVRNDPSFGHYLWNFCPKSHAGYCRTYIAQVVTVKAGVSYDFVADFSMSGVRNQANIIEVYVETVDRQTQLFDQYIFSGNTNGWTKFATNAFTPTVSGDVLVTYTWRNDPNDATIQYRSIKMTPLECRDPASTKTCSAEPEPTSTTSSEPTSTTSSESTSTTSSKSTSTSPPEPTYTPPYPSVKGYDWVDCWKETTTGRLLSGATTASDDMTLEKCADFCTAWPYFGTEYGRECYCGPAPSSTSSAVDIEECKAPCAGDTTQVCGDGGRVSLYYNTSKGGPKNPDSVAGSARFGCMTESPQGRTLSGKGFGSDDMSLELCESSCLGYQFWGVEYGRECYCGNSLRDGTEQVADGSCDKICSGNPAQLCGSGGHLMVYQRP